MQELINTSVPNGLIAGTHGFATVAMTPGIGERLRLKLEDLSAYRHRSSAHDASYETENPIGWSHVVPLAGQHVCSRVGAAPFDYTGRTNRIGHHVVLTDAEMGGAGGAAWLLGMQSRLSEPWSGEPRTLDGAALAGLRPSRRAGTSAWERVFGTAGADLAKRLAWYLERDLSAAAKPVYFVTDCARDRNGQELLALFAEVAELMPSDLRDALTFATFPDGLPQGLTCTLRGSYGTDVRPGCLVFDCRSGALRSGGDLLPTERGVPMRATAPARNEVASPVLVSSRGGDTPASPTEEADLPPDRRQPLVKAIAAAAGVLLIAVLAAVFAIVGRSGRSRNAVAPESRTVERRGDAERKPRQAADARTEDVVTVQPDAGVQTADAGEAVRQEATEPKVDDEVVPVPDGRLWLESADRAAILKLLNLAEFVGDSSVAVISIKAVVLPIGQDPESDPDAVKEKAVEIMWRDDLDFAAERDKLMKQQEQDDKTAKVWIISYTRRVTRTEAK